LYTGVVTHRRLRPAGHRLRYRAFWLLLDLDEIDRLPRVLRLLSRNRFNAVSHYDRDHGDGSATPLRAQAERHLHDAGIDLGGGAITLFCMPRILGYGFNPLSLYFCRRADGTLAAILYEVHNTFGERHSYLIPVEGSVHGAIEQQCRKVFYVSPFLDMTLRYDFRVAGPDEQIAVTVRASDDDGPMLMAALAGRRAALTDAMLARMLLTFPLMTLKVIAAIHWHALRMILKGFALRRRPPPPTAPVTVVNAKVTASPA
jgi:DUF1365 family protein